MSKLVMSILTIIMITTITGTSIMSADAGGKPIRSSPVVDVITNEPRGILCGSESLVSLEIITITTTWPDETRVKSEVTSSGTAINADTKEFLGTIKGSEVFDNRNDGKGVDRYQLRQSVHCVGGGTDNFIMLKTITHN